jgi:hypothetical protein
MKSSMENKKILLGLTTTFNSNWKEKIEETGKFNITEVALFPTALKIRERKELYKRLENSPVRNIPHVHIRSDFELWEMDYLSEKYQTQVFNHHPEKKYGLENDLAKYWKKIYVENSNGLPAEKELQKYAGL